MRPKIHLDTFYIPVNDGICIRNNRATLILKGKTLYRWLEHLAPYFTGHYSLEEITSGLDDHRKSMVNELVETLFNHHFLADASLDQPHSLSQNELSTYASEIAFIETFQPSAARRFEDFRHLRVLIVGSGISSAALIRSCLHGGIKTISVIRTTEEESVSGISSAIDASRLFAPRDPSQHVQELDAPCWEDERAIAQIIKPFDAILHISDCPMLARVRLLNMLCLEQKKILLQSCFVDDVAWTGPLVKPESEGCWECAWRRLQSTLQKDEQLLRYAIRDHKALAPSRWFAFPAAALAANHLVFELFKLQTQAGPLETVGTIVAVDLETLTSSNHAFTPHPYCQACQHPSAPNAATFLEQIDRIQQLEPIDEAAFSKQAAQCFDSRSGIITSIDEGNFEQLPLAVCKVQCSLPTQLKQLEVIAVGSNFHIARQRATRRACELYTANVVDLRRLVTEKTAVALPLEQIVSTTSCPSSSEIWCWMLDPATRQCYLIPANLCFPSLQQGITAEIDSPGIGSGLCWSEAVCHALLSWACYLTVAQLSDGQHPYRKLALSSISLTTEGEHLFGLLKAVDALPDVYPITGSLGVPTFAICTGAQTVAYTSHCDALEALVMGLELALQQYQSNSTQQPEYAVPSTTALPVSLRSDQCALLPDGAVAHSWLDRQEWLMQRFQENGWQVLITPLNHDPALAQIWPFSVRVLLSQEKRKKEWSFQ